MNLAVIAGYYGFGNAGDEMILRVLLDQLRIALPDHEWTVLSNRPEETSLKLGVSSVDRWGLLAIASLFRRARLLVLGGGELFQSQTSLFSLFYYLGLFLLAKLFRCRTCLLAVGTSRFERGWEARIVRSILRSADFIWVRDEESYRFFAHSIPTDKIKQIPDPVWLWPVPSVKKNRSSVSADRRICWILRPIHRREMSSAPLPDFLNRLFERNPEWSFGFLPMHPALDMPFLSALFQRLNGLHRLEKWGEERQIPEILASYDLVVSMRYHGLLLSGLVSTPFIGLYAHDKARRFCESVGAPAIAYRELSEDARGSADRFTGLDPFDLLPVRKLTESNHSSFNAERERFSSVLGEKRGVLS
ncbi:MAG TPA: polysaccharide pyruvyl transferase family protein [Elusimicrobiota bacterium]|nr:polysaccharide pyruvyl transferase family protein [Elusimicrobiota bacterium]